ncbi:class D sortase [Bacillus fonticola]|uniref:class D sortase n=1 Tax=Bacillus fonticola TaxID=2728853 RepID=UPI0014734D5B|nr:class D sortase [Bacillus fonticola]
MNLLNVVRWLSIALIIAGLTFTLYAVNQIFESKNAEQRALNVAKQIVEGKSVPDRRTLEPTKKAFAADITEESSAKPIEGDVIGILEIPAIKAELPVVEGTDEDELAKGVGHYSTTALPGEGDQILLSGHRDSVFRKLGDVKIGDELTVRMPGGTYTYIMTSSKIVDANDTTVIRSTAPNEILTLSTCYPFGFLGDAPDRYIIEAVLKEE